MGGLSGRWNFKFPGILNFKLKFSGGKLTIGRQTINLMPSDRMDYSTALGWLKFNFRKWNFYIKFNPTDFQVVAFNQFGQQVTGAVTKVVGGIGGGIPSNSKCSVT